MRERKKGESELNPENADLNTPVVASGLLLKQRDAMRHTVDIGCRVIVNILAPDQTIPRGIRDEAINFPPVFKIPPEFPYREATNLGAHARQHASG